MVGLMERGWRRLMEGCWTSSPFVVASLWRINVVTHHCRLVITSPGCVVVVLCCCPCAVLLSLAHCGPVLCLNEVGGRWDGGTYLASTTMNDGCCSSFWLPRLSTTWYLHSPLATGGHFHLWVVVSICGWPFPPMGGCLHS